MERWNEKVKDLLIQGDFLNLLISDIWAYMVCPAELFNLKWEVPQTHWPLQTIYSAGRKLPATLVRCVFNRTVDHIRPHCSTSSTIVQHSSGQWEIHDFVLSYITLTLKENKPENIQIDAGLDGHKINGTTIPPHITVTSWRCDLVIIDSSSSPPTVYLLEPILCFERPGNLEAANQRKYERYTPLTEDIKDAGYLCTNIPFEVGSHGHYPLRTSEYWALCTNCVLQEPNFQSSGRMCAKPACYVRTQYTCHHPLECSLSLTLI